MNKRKDDKTKDFRKTQHSVYLITLHVVLVIKYRRKVLTNPISDEVRRIFTYIGEEHGVEIVEWNHDLDHVHMLLSISPSTNLTKYLNAAKAASSRLIQKDYPEAKEKLWEKKFWTRGFYASSTGTTNLEVVKQYIQHQGGREDGAQVVTISRWYPSSQLCSNCNTSSGKKPLHVRDWTCETCGAHHDRDVNAAKNILHEGLRLA